MNFTKGHARERVRGLGTPRKGPLGNLSVPTTLKMNNFSLNSNFAGLELKLEFERESKLEHTPIGCIDNKTNY